MDLFTGQSDTEWKTFCFFSRTQKWQKTVQYKCEYVHELWYLKKEAKQVSFGEIEMGKYYSSELLCNTSGQKVILKITQNVMKGLSNYLQSYTYGI